MKKLTSTQNELLKKLELYKYVKNSNGIFKYDDIKNVCEFKTFDATFNALLNLGYLERIKTDDFSNKYKLNEVKIRQNFINSIDVNHLQYYWTNLMLTQNEYITLKNKFNL